MLGNGSLDIVLPFFNVLETSNMPNPKNVIFSNFGDEKIDFSSFFVVKSSTFHNYAFDRVE